MKDYSRREVLELGMGSAVLAVGGGELVAAAGPGPAPVTQEEERLPPSSEFNHYGEDLEKYLMLRTSPIAVKMLEKEAGIPEGAMRPFKDRGYHLSQCQAFALSRREGTTVAMLKEDHWCPAPLIAYGMVKRTADRIQQSQSYDSFPYGKYVGIVTAPLRRANFRPDVVIIYSNTSQLRGLILSMGNDESSQINSRYLPPSCSYSVVNVMTTGKYWVVLPDPGEYQRALGTEDEMMFAVPAKKMETLIAGLRKNENGAFAYRNHHPFMQPDFPRPDFYKEMFKSWGLDAR
jgi:uncharacterized protein (DUF169 family)